MTDEEIQPDMIFKLSNRRSAQEVKLRSLEWAVVTQIDGEKTVGQIAEILSLTPHEMREIFSRLIHERLLDLVGMPQDIAYIPKKILDDIQNQLMYFLGPVSEIVVEEVLDELNSTKSKFRKKKLPLLIELLSVEISNPKKRYEFQKRMLERMKELG